MLLYSKRPTDGSVVRISVNYSRQLVFGEHEYMQFFNILMRKCLGALNLQLVGRNFFDPHAKVHFLPFLLFFYVIVSFNGNQNNYVVLK
jgi:aubergine-like protein